MPFRLNESIGFRPSSRADDGAASAATSTTVAAAASTLLRHAQRAAWRGPDPYDGLWWTWPRPLVAGRRRRQVLMQLHARAPVDVRRLYRRTHPLVPKALAIFASTGLRLDRFEGSDLHTATVGEALDLLLADTTAGPDAWGYHWDMQTRWSFYPAGSPNVVVTAFAFAALREAAERWPDGPYDERAHRAAQWVVEHVWLDSGGHFVYHPGSEVNIHNANLLAARMVDEAFADDTHAQGLVKQAVDRTLAGQSPDGSFPYGVGRNLGFVDCFHTGYVLDCLSALRHVDSSIDGAISRGVSYWLKHFFHRDGGVSLWPDKRYPEDAHSSGTALTTLAALDPTLDLGTAMSHLGGRVLSVGLHRDQAVFRRYGRMRSGVRYMRWCDAHLALGLANAAHALTP